MIFRRYGTAVHSVAIEFNSKALTEIGFRRDRVHSMPTEDFDSDHTCMSSHELATESEGDVQDHVEQRMLDDLEAQLRSIMGEMDEGEVILVHSEQGVDYPKTRTRTKNVIVEGENRLYFYASIDPPLRVGVYRKS
jgi:hypothetical protein